MLKVLYTLFVIFTLNIYDVNGFSRGYKSYTFDIYSSSSTSKSASNSTVKNAPIIDYKNISLLKKYISENNKILSSKITSVSSGKQKRLTKEIKKAIILGLI